MKHLVLKILQLQTFCLKCFNACHGFKMAAQYVWKFRFNIHYGKVRVIKIGIQYKWRFFLMIVISVFKICLVLSQTSIFVSSKTPSIKHCQWHDRVSWHQLKYIENSNIFPIYGLWYLLRLQNGGYKTRNSVVI